MKHVEHWKTAVVNDWIIYLSVGTALASYLGRLAGRSIVHEALFAVGTAGLGYIAYLFHQVHLAAGVGVIILANVVLDRSQKVVFGPVRFVDLFYLVISVGQVLIACGVTAL